MREHRIDEVPKENKQKSGSDMVLEKKINNNKGREKNKQTDGP